MESETVSAKQLEKALKDMDWKDYRTLYEKEKARADDYEKAILKALESVPFTLISISKKLHEALLPDGGVMKSYCIELYSEGLGKWLGVGIEFSAMRETYAYGAWAMLKAHYGAKQKKYRLVQNCGDVVEEWQRSKVEPQ